ncbi:MAG: AAA family ATPase [Acidimicrobiia bacterium]|nr:AAA family ATPase [Acidimicrobiia bacterium]
MGDPTPTCAAVLAALADLAPGGAARRRAELDVTTAGRSLVWLGTDVEVGELLGPSYGGRFEDVEGVPIPASSREAARRLAAVDALHPDEHLLRVGWVWLAGTLDDGDGPVDVLHPLLSAPVGIATGMLERLSGTARLVRAGDVELTALAGADESLETLESEVPFPPARYEITRESLGRFPALAAWVNRVVAACGLGTVQLVGAENPTGRRGTEGLSAVVGSGLYLGRAVEAVDLGSALRSWAVTPGVSGTAVAAVLAPEDHTGGPRSAVPPYDPPVELTAAQHDALRRARHDPIVVVAGPAGTGKTQVAVAGALDALASGASVLLAAQTEHAVEVLADRLAALPGPSPVVFGGSQRRRELAAEMAAGLDGAVAAGSVGELRRRYTEAQSRLEWTLDAVREVLERERRAERAERRSGALAQMAAPGAFTPDVDLSRLDDLVRRAADPGNGWWSERRQRRADRSLRRLVGASDRVPLDRLRHAVEVAGDRRIAAELASQGGTSVGAGWDEVEAAVEERLAAAGGLLDVASRSGAARARPARQAAAALATALRAGRAARRRMLRDVDPAALLAALPLWVGTLRDIDDLLPAEAAMFDLVILDEASQIDLPRAATALARGARAMIVGDPHQLRHVSFVADAAVEDVLRAHGLPPVVRSRLDVRRSSAFDAATAVAAPVWLEEHFRSVPHLVEFPAARFSPVPVHIVTRHPRNDRQRAIDVRRVDGQREEDGVNRREVTEAMTLVEQAVADGCRSIGVVTPFRAHADALEHAVLDRFTLEDITAFGLRVGTVHAFQGNERDLMVVSLALDDDTAAASRRFVEDPNLFNVMVTRARQRLVVVTSLREPPAGLLADFLRHAERPPQLPPPLTPADTPWVRQLATELDRAGVVVRQHYPVGAMTLDLVVGDGADAVGLECAVHPAGPTAHIVRHRVLRRMGWRLLEAWPTRFDGDVARAAVVLCGELGLDP